MKEEYNTKNRLIQKQLQDTCADVFCRTPYYRKRGEVWRRSSKNLYIGRLRRTV